MKIPAITIYQPWASLIACGAKKYETRSWATKYRGRIAIHAAAKPVLPWFQREVEQEARLEITKTLAEHRKCGNIGTGIITWLPRGYVIATAELVGCYEIEQYDDGTIFYDYVKGIPEYLNKRACPTADVGYPYPNEVLFGDWTPGRYAWELHDVKMLAEPISAKGKQRLWYFDMPDEIVEERESNV